MLSRLFWLLVLVLLLCAAAYGWATWHPLPLPQATYAFSVKQGATLRSVARDLTAAGIIPADWVLVGLARGTGVDRAIKAGNYEIATGTTLRTLLAKLTQGDVTQTGFTIVEGWNMSAGPTSTLRDGRRWLTLPPMGKRKSLAIFSTSAPIPTPCHRTEQRR